MTLKMFFAVLTVWLGGIIIGATGQAMRDRATITEAQRKVTEAQHNEWQANGLEDECKAQLVDVQGHGGKLECVTCSIAPSK